VQGNEVQSDNVQHMAVSALGELQPRPSWCTGRSHAVREVLQREDSGRTRPGGSRVARDGRRRPLRRKQRTRSGGTANYSCRIWRWPDAGRPRPPQRRRVVMARRAGRRSGEARRSCRSLRGCADCIPAAHAREQWRFSP
jgi:hypothetical protein